MEVTATEMGLVEKKRRSPGTKEMQVKVRRYHISEQLRGNKNLVKNQ